MWTNPLIGSAIRMKSVGNCLKRTDYLKLPFSGILVFRTHLTSKWTGPPKKSQISLKVVHIFSGPVHLKDFFLIQVKIERNVPLRTWAWIRKKVSEPLHTVTWVVFFTRALLYIKNKFLDEVVSGLLWQKIHRKLVSHALLSNLNLRLKPFNRSNDVSLAINKYNYICVLLSLLTLKHRWPVFCSISK